MDRPIVSENAMSDNPAGHMKTNEYVFRLPTPPRHVIPPFTSWNHAEPNPTIGELISHADQEINIDFLRGTGFDAVLKNVSTGAGQNWKYENRRQAQDILSYLWLGPLTAARDKEFLQREGITLMVGIQHKSGLGPKLTMGAMRVADELGIAKATLEVGSNQDLIALFPTATRIINSHLREMYNRAMLNPSGGIRPGKVLIFCESGNDKSAAVAAAYLMDNFEGADYIKACQLCNLRRFCCSFDDSIKNYLCSYDDILQAKRTVAAARPQLRVRGMSFVTNPMFGATSDEVTSPQATAAAHAVGNGNAKRGRERDGEDDEMMDMGDAAMEDADRFEGRNFAPFR
jgi:hypothetical protein